jgi:hypothetical protein
MRTKIEVQEYTIKNDLNLQYLPVQIGSGLMI